MKNFFGRLFGSKSRQPERRKSAAPAQPPSDAPSAPGASEYLFKPGEVINGKYEVHRMIGKGRLGVAFLAYSKVSKGACVLRVFPEDSLPNRACRKAISHNALLWVDLGSYPFIRAARAVDEAFEHMFLVMDYVAPDDRGRVSLRDHLRQTRGPLDTDQALEWAIEFCQGMEYATGHGIRCHGDIRPHHILIARDRTVKISDFGLAAGALTASFKGGRLGVGKDEGGGAGFSVVRGENGRWCGTPGYIAPELHGGSPSALLGGASMDLRSDLYSFGVVLWQMAAGREQPPFVAGVPYSAEPRQYLEAVHQKQVAAPAPPVAGPLASAVARCLDSDPAGRYADFGDLRRELEKILRQRTGRSAPIPETGERAPAFWINKGSGLDSLGRHEEAIASYGKALSIAPDDADAWNCRGGSFESQGRHEEAILCFDKALGIAPRNASAWNNKGNSLHSLGRDEDAVLCFNKALETDPRHAGAWYNKGGALNVLGQYEEAILCYDNALAIDPRIGGAWDHKGGSPDSLGRNEEPKAAVEQVLAAHAGDRTSDHDALSKALGSLFREGKGKAG